MDPRKWTFDIDRYLNRAVPPPPWNHLPYPIAWFLGYRKPEDQPQATGNLLPIFWAFIGIFCGVSVIEVVSLNIPSFRDQTMPIIVGSFGAAAVLEFYAIESPLAQPRNAVLGQLLSAIVGVAVCRLFLLSDDFQSIQWVGGAIACASATALMALTKTVHPPAGATALLAVTDDSIVGLGWFLIPVILLGCGLMMTVALLINNIGRRFPQHWWTAADLSRKKANREVGNGSDDAEKGKAFSNGASVDEQSSARDEEEGRVDGSDGDEPRALIIRREGLVLPEDFRLTKAEMSLLESIQDRL